MQVLLSKYHSSLLQLTLDWAKHNDSNKSLSVVQFIDKVVQLDSF